MRDKYSTGTPSRGVVASLLIGLSLVGCEIIEPTRVELTDLTASAVYQPPGTMSVAKEAVADQPPDAVREALIARFQTDEFAVSSANPDDPYLVLIYRGAPERYVDCGLIAVASEAADVPPVSVAGAQAQTRIPDLDGAPGSVLDREMRLLSRIVVQLQPLDPDDRTLITTDTTYVLTKTLTRTGADGQALRQGRETISFDTDEVATFDKGTTCRATGRMEALVYDAASGVAIAVASSEQPIEEIGTAGADPAGASVAGTGVAAAGAAAAELAVTDVAAADIAVAQPAIPIPNPVDVPVVAVVAPVAPPDPAEVERSIDAAIGPVSCADIRRFMGQDGRLVLSGFVESQAVSDQISSRLRDVPGVAGVDNRLAVERWPFCEVLTTIAPYRSASSLMALSVIEDSDGDLSEGEELVLLLEGVPAGSHILISYFKQNNQVVHIGPIRPENLLPIGLSTFRLNTNLAIRPPFGREFATAVVSREELFLAPRSSVEAAEDFLPVLRDRLLELHRAEGGREAPVALPVFFSTRPLGAS